MNGTFGVLRIESGWPFAHFPSFARLGQPTQETLTIAVKTVGGTVVPLALPTLPPERLNGLIWHILHTKDAVVQQRRLASLWRTVPAQDHQSPASVLFFRDTVSVLPSSPRALLARELLTEVPLKRHASTE